MDARFFLLRSKVSPSVRFNTSVPFHSGSVNPENPMENRYRFLPLPFPSFYEFRERARERATDTLPKGRRVRGGSRIFGLSILNYKLSKILVGTLKDCEQILKCKRLPRRAHTFVESVDP